MKKTSRIARQLRERLEIDRLFGWSVPIGKAASRRPGKGASQRDGEASSRAASARGPDSSDRESVLGRIRDEVAACKLCSLCRTRTQTVFGTGDPNARLLFVGEAPGFDEDREGEPFVGLAGKLLTDIIKAMGLERGQVYIANVIKCRPPQNRTPNPAEVGSCLPYLERQIAILQPQAIVALGAVAAKALLGVELPISRVRGRFHDYHGIPLMPTYHPAYLLRNPEEKRKVWEDVQLVMARLGLSRPRKR
jgi:uracil-DNA glycosylase family 4